MSPTILLCEVDPATEAQLQHDPIPDLTIIRCDEPEQIRLLLARQTRHPEVAVLGSGLARPVRLAEQIHAVAKDMTILILAATDATAIQRAIQASPFLGNETICLLAGRGVNLSPMLREAIARTQRLRSYHALLASAQQSMPAMAPARGRPQQYLDRLLDHAPIGVVLIDQGGLVQAWNRSSERIFGVAEQAAVGRMLVQIVPAVAIEPLSALIGRAATDQAAAETIAIPQPAGGRRWIEITATPIAQPTSARQVLLIIQDITELKQAEESLRSSERHLSQIMAALPVGVFLLNAAGMPVYANQAAQDMLGQGILPQTRTDQLAEVYQAYLADTDQEYPAARMPVVRALQGEATSIEDMEIRPAGKKFLLSVSGRPILDEDGNLLYALAVFSDITARKHAEAEQTRLQQEIIRMQQSMLAELSTPTIPLTSDSLVIPLVGAMDDQRARSVLDALLRGVSETRARLAIIDITGVPIVDSQVASVLLQAAQATRLLGAEVILTGIRAEVAQTLVGLGIEMKDIVTLSTLEKGISYAMSRRR